MPDELIREDAMLPVEADGVITVVVLPVVTSPVVLLATEVALGDAPDDRGVVPSVSPLVVSDVGRLLLEDTVTDCPVPRGVVTVVLVGWVSGVVRVFRVTEDRELEVVSEDDHSE